MTLPKHVLDWAFIDDDEVEFVIAAIKRLDDRCAKTGPPSERLQHSRWLKLWTHVADLINGLNTNEPEWVPVSAEQLTTDWQEEGEENGK